MKKRIFSALLISALAVSALTACGGSSSAKKSGQTLTVLNYGKYIDESVVKQFEKETGITVKYEEYESPEEMYTKYKAGSINYDVICSSEYMVERLINEGEVLEEDYDAMDNYKNLDPTILDMSASYDRNHTYSVPYFYGTLGLLYNKTTIDAKTVSSWNCLWDPTYEDEIIMENSVRDTFAPALISKGYSLNDTDENHLREALDVLKKQKDDKIVYAYYVDETADAMIGEEASIALCYSGEAALAMAENDNLDYSVPTEGSNLWIDSWFIPKSCKNQENAEKFLDFLCREDVAMKNFDYVCYATPNLAVIDALDNETLSDTTIFPPQETLDNCTVYKQFDESTTSLYSYLWKKLKSE